MTINKNNKSLNFHWTAASLASGLGGLVPIPFVEEYIDHRAKHHAIRETFNSYEIEVTDEILDTLCCGSSHKSPWIFRKIIELPVSLLLLPLRKTIKILWHTKDIPSDFAHTYLLARCLDRCLKKGLLNNSDSHEIAQQQSAKIRQSYDRAFAEIDDLALHSLVLKARREISNIKPSLLKLVLKISGRKVKKSEDLSAETAELQRLSKVESLQESEVSQRKESKSFAAFDRNFDRHLTIILYKEETK